MSQPSDCPPPSYVKAWHEYTGETSPRRPGRQTDLLIDEDLPEDLASVIERIDLTEPPNLYTPNNRNNSNRNDPNRGETE